MANSFDIASFNLINWANSVVDLYDSTPKDVEIIQKDNNGNLFTKDIANRGKFKQELWDDIGSALGQFNRTFYVDAENGDDNNNGDSYHPFKTIKKAIDSVPVGGAGVIHINDDYVMDNNINLIRKSISIFSNGSFIFPSELDGDDNIFPYQIKAADSSIYFAVNKIITKVADSSKNWKGNANVAICQYVGRCGDRAIGSLNVVIDTKCQNDVNVIELHGGVLVGNQTAWGGGAVTPINLSLKRFDYSGTSYVLKNGGVLLDSYKVATFSVSSNIKVQDSDGNDLKWSDVVSDIIKDSDSGNPINLISNVNFSD